MALGWLEASRYADTDGYQNDRLRYMWVWRDWVIRFNDNMPFDRFVTEQMAGDLLPDRNFSLRSPPATIATTASTPRVARSRTNGSSSTSPTVWRQWERCSSASR